MPNRSEPIVSEEARQLLNTWDPKTRYTQERRRVIAEIEEKYREELARAGFFRRFLIRWKKGQELAHELEKLDPGPYSLGVVR